MSEAAPAKMDAPLAIGVLGASAFTLGFELAGIRHVFSTEGLNDGERIARLFDAIKHPELGVLIVEDKDMNVVPTQDRVLIENYIRPVVIVLSSTVSDSSSLRRQIMRAIGVDVYNDDAS